MEFIHSADILFSQNLVVGVGVRNVVLSRLHCSLGPGKFCFQFCYQFVSLYDSLCKWHLPPRQYQCELLIAFIGGVCVSAVARRERDRVVMMRRKARQKKERKAAAKLEAERKAAREVSGSECKQTSSITKTLC